MLVDFVSGNTLVYMFKRHGMSQVEYDFIRTYVSAMRRDYYLLRGVLNMMNPDDLGIKSVVEATNLAVKAGEMHSEFERQLGVVKDKNKYHPKHVADDPPPSAMADLFSLSFFTVAISTAAPGSPANGLFSGEPSTLAEMLQHLQQKNDSLKNSDAAKQFLTLLKMFSATNDNSVFEFWSTVADMFKNGAGLAYYGNFGQAYEQGYGEYEEEQDYADDEEYDDEYDEDDDFENDYGD